MQKAEHGTSTIDGEQRHFLMISKAEIKIEHPNVTLRKALFMPKEKKNINKKTKNPKKKQKQNHTKPVEGGLCHPAKVTNAQTVLMLNCCHES